MSPRQLLAVTIGAFVLRIAVGAQAGPLPPATPPSGPAEALAPNPRATPAAPAPLALTDTAESVDGPSATAPALKPGIPAAVCPNGMVLVEGDYCTQVRQTCKHWLDNKKLPFARCGEYEKPARCVGHRVHMRFCIDRYEYTRPGEQLPANYQSFATASRLCKKLGKRICTESEWNFACEGEQMRPYPYGWKRESVCNQDQPDLYEPNSRHRVLRDLRKPADANPSCVSPFGVYDMVGNLDEPVLKEGAPLGTRFRDALKGGWWMAGRNRCRPATTAHDDYYNDIQVGVRCCADAPGDGLGGTG